MYQVNLLPWREVAQRRRLAFWLRLLCMQSAVAALVPLVLFGALRYQQGQQRDVVQALAQRQTKLTVRLQQTQQVAARLARLTAEETRHQQNQAHNLRYLHVLQRLSVAVPAPLWLSTLEENAQGISLRGFSQHYAAIAQLEQRLAAQPLLQGNRLVEVAQREDGVLAFTFIANWGSDG